MEKATNVCVSYWKFGGFLTLLGAALAPGATASGPDGMGTSPDELHVVSNNLLPGPFSPLEDTADNLIRRFFRLLPSKKHLPPHLHRPHDDYPLLFRWIPRGWTSFDWGQPALILGNQDTWYEGGPKPIGPPGTFQLSRYPDLPPPLCWLPLYVAFTTPHGVHLRLGARWDDIDSYVQFPSVALKFRVREEQLRPGEPAVVLDEQRGENEGDGGKEFDQNVQAGSGGVF